MKNSFFEKREKKIKLTNTFPKMIWLGEDSLYEQAIFIRNYNQFIFMIDELSYALSKRECYEQKSIDN